MDLFKRIAPLALIVVGLLGSTGVVNMQGCDFSVLPIPIVHTVDPVKTEGAYVLVIEETGERTDDVAMVLQNYEYWQGLKARGLVWSRYDRDDVPYYSKVIDEVGLPLLLILDKEGQVLAKEKLPKPSGEGGTDGVDAIVKEATGR